MVISTRERQDQDCSVALYRTIIAVTDELP